MRSPSPLATVVALSILATAVVTGACKKKEPDAKPADPVAAAASDAAAATTPPPAAADGGAVATTPATTGGPFFWKVSKDGKTSHFFGTIHLGVDAKKDLPPSVWAQLDAAKSFAMETNPGDPSLISAVMRTDHNTTLATDLGPDYWAKFQAAVGADLAEGMKAMKPMAGASVLVLKELPQTANMDTAFLEHAKAGGKQIGFLEAPLSQIALLDKYLTADSIKAMLDNPGALKEGAAKLLAVYKSGDEAALVALTNDPAMWLTMGGLTAEDQKVMLDDLLYSRNTAWIPGLEQALAAGDAFVAVGAMHLVGERSVLAQLKAKGYTVERVQ